VEERVKRLILIIAVLALAVTGCGGGDDVTVDGQWARNSPKNAQMGAAYMNITSADGDTLVGGSVDSSVSASVEVHAMRPVEGQEDEEGMALMEMVEIPELELPAGETVNLAPGGYHIMFINIAKPLELGQMIDLTLHFETADDMVIEVEVTEEAP
jgi:copper(I)-binding protein